MFIFKEKTVKESFNKNTENFLSSLINFFSSKIKGKKLL
jgi:hypothetical protein